MANQTIFRMLEHPKSTHFCGRKINAKGISGAFGARDYLNQSHGIIGSAVDPEEWGLVKATARNAFFKAQTRYFLQCSQGTPQLSKDEMAFFIKFYPLSMIRDGIISLIAKEIAELSHELIENKIRMTKHNLTSLFAVLSGEKPLSIVTSSSEIDVFSDISSISLGRHGSALFHPLDRSSWLVSQSKQYINSVDPEIFYTNEGAAGAMLGYPQSAVDNYTGGGDADSMRTLMFTYDMRFRPWLFDFVFVPKIDLHHNILDEGVLIKWHETLGKAVGSDILELLNLEAKITTIIRLAAAVEKEKIRNGSDTAQYESG
ncbi:MAG: hypothetical protein NTY68_03060 [Candidatus Micrarchaeota archaeon]|nr:hypothetical protein [Candidatus Micrarchaeota archaeon]